MYTYPKPPLSNADLIKKLQAAELDIPDVADAERVLLEIGYYRLKGYFFDLIDSTTKKFPQGTTFDSIVGIYEFDTKLSHLLFGFLTQIEIALRARLVASLTKCNDALILNDPSIFSDKEMYWKNQSAVASEIARSNDVFINHHLKHYEGAIPIWAAVEVMSFGTLSKIIKTLKTGSGSVYSDIASYYLFRTQNGNTAVPSKEMLSSWIQTASVIRNICAHNSRIYNRSFATIPRLLKADAIKPAPKFNGIYQVILAMKYLRPSDDTWTNFVTELDSLLTEYSNVVSPKKLHFPNDWRNHF